MNRLLKPTVFGISSIILLIGVVSINLGFTSEEEDFNITTYLQLADENSIYPTATQIEMLEKVLPDHTYKPSPNINDRAYWDTIATLQSGKKYLQRANSFLDKKPEVPISDEIYRRANIEGNRGIYKPRYYRTMERLEHFILAECIENKGRFIPQIKIYMRAIMDMKSWLHPNHDDDQNSNLEGKSITIDLGARKFGTDLTLALVLLGNKLPKALKKEASALVQKRITDSYLTSCKGENNLNKWIRSTSNWNSVCNSGTIFSTITNSKDTHERLVAIGCMLNSSKYYLSGFGDDGYCSEGIGYWSYGFGHYLYLAQIFHDYTNGKINMFDFDNADKMNNVGNFPENFEIQNSYYAPFADGNIVAANQNGNFTYALSAYYYGALKPDSYKFEEASEQLIAWKNPEIFTVPETKKKNELPNVTFFETSGMVISRGKQKWPFSIAIKAGHNAENHNHSDVGTYTLLLGEDFICGDIGAPSYTAGSFSPTNKARSSWGHPVPLINNILQSNGRSFEGEITVTNFSDDKDEVVLNLKSAYEVSALKTLERVMVNDKTKQGVITIRDTFSATEPIDFGTAIMTFSKYEIINPSTLILTSVDHNLKLKVTIESDDGLLKIYSEPVPVQHLRNGKDAVRIGINFEKPIQSGSIIIKYTPLN